MAQIIFSILFISFTVLGFSSSVKSRSNARAYLEAQCQTSLYRDLCVETLLPYATKAALGPQQLARVSLAVCLSKARETNEYVAKHLNQSNHSGNNKAIQECLRQIKSGIDQITLSVKEVEQMGKDGEEKFVLHEGNVQSWVSAAVTDVDMCIDGLVGDGVETTGREEAIIKAKLLNVKQIASNSLSLFRRFGSRHRASHIVKNPYKLRVR